jgi:Zn-dependent protease
MRQWSIGIGRVLGVELRVHYSFLFLAAFVWLMEALPPTPEGFGRGVALSGLVLVCVVVRELGFIVVARRLELPVRHTALLPIGGIHFTDDPDTSDEARAERGRREMLAAAAGPIASFVAAGLAATVIKIAAPEVRLWTHPLIHSGAWARSLVWLNVLIGVLNLLPAFPLDGGRVLRALMLRRVPNVIATRRAAGIGHMIAMALIFAGYWDLWFTLIGALIFIGALLEERSVMFQSVLETVRMEDVMLTDFATLSPADTLEDALQKAVHSLQDDFPVVRGSDLVGSISRKGITEALRAHGNGYVQAAMRRVGDVAPRQESIATALRRLTPRGHTLIPVVENDRLVGIVTLQNLMRSVALLAESRRLRRTRPQS